MGLPLFMIAAQVAGIAGDVIQSKKERKFYGKQSRLAQEQIDALEPYERAYEQNAVQALDVVDRSYLNAEAGTKIEKDLLGLRMEQEGLAYTEASVFANEELRSVLSSQRALLSSRGANSEQGSARAIRNATLGAFGEDERARSISKNFRDLMLKGQSSLYDIQSETNLINRGAGVLGIQAGLLDKKASLQNTRAQLKGAKGQAQLAKSQVGAKLFQNIMGQLPFSEASGIFLNDSNIGKAGPKGKINSAQLAALTGR